MIIEGAILDVGAAMHLTDIDGTPVVLAMDDPAFVNELLESLQEYIDAVHPPLLIEHNRDGLRRGEALKVFAGEDPQTGRTGVRVRVRVDDERLQALAHLIRRFSLFLIRNPRLSDGRVLPWGLAEISTVSVPMYDAGQPDVLIAAASAYGALQPTNDCAILAQDVDHGASLAQPMERKMSILSEFIAELQAAAPADLEALRALLMPAAPPAPAPAVEIESAPPAPPVADPTMIAMSAKLDKLADVVERLAATAPPSAPGSIAAAALRNGTVGGGVHAPAAPAKPDVFERARAIQREKNVSYSKAHALALQEV